MVYCHGNSGSRLDSEEILESVLKSGMSLFCFDFSGCGISEGEYVTLGHYEKEDISTVVKHIYSVDQSINIVLWGRSMGAVACMLYTYHNPFIVTMVLDSPFADFSQVADEMISEYKIIPKFLRNFMLNLTADYIQSVTAFDIRELAPKKYIKNCKIPTIFIHSGDDKLVNIQHSRELYSEFKGPKCFVEITGEHNTVRDKTVVIKALKIVQFLIVKYQNEEQELVTVREHMPEMKPRLAEIIKHRRVFSQESHL